MLCGANIYRESKKFTLSRRLQASVGHVKTCCCLLCLSSSGTRRRTFQTRGTHPARRLRVSQDGGRPRRARPVHPVRHRGDVDRHRQSAIGSADGRIVAFIQRQQHRAGVLYAHVYNYSILLKNKMSLLQYLKATALRQSIC